VLVVPMYALARHDSADRLVAFAIFTPTPTTI